jgi:hypothetical protein
MMLHAIHYFMGMTITLTDYSVEEVASHLNIETSRTGTSRTISKLLNRQVKSAMHGLLREMTDEVLHDLEKELLTKGRKAWATYFCVVSVLCMCIEEIQKATDGFVMHKYVNKMPADDADSQTCIDDSQTCIDACRQLDEFPFKYVTELFHGVFKTRKAATADHVYNPIRDGPEINGRYRFDQNSQALIYEMQQILVDYSESTLKLCHM